MSAAIALDEFMAAEREVADATLPDGSRKILAVVGAGREFLVLHVVGEERREVARTAFRDLATGWYDAFDGVDRGWHPAYLPRGINGRDEQDAKTALVFAAGADVEGCVRGFLDSLGDRLREGSLVVGEARKDEFQWDCAFVSDAGGTGFRAAGRSVPGGVVMTWWK